MTGQVPVVILADSVLVIALIMAGVSMRVVLMRAGAR